MSDAEDREEPPSSSADPQRMALTGFMGCGKSTVGNILAQRLGWSFVDIDQRIEAVYSASASALFQTVGEAEFRKIEADIMVESLAVPQRVVALGGAAVDLAENQNLLRYHYPGVIIFLDGDFEVLINRCLQQEQTTTSTYRPLLHQRERAFTRFASRREWNSAHAHLRIDVSRQSCEQCASEILRHLATLGGESPAVGGAWLRRRRGPGRSGSRGPT
jgi:shikimate kinase